MWVVEKMLDDDEFFLGEALGNPISPEDNLLFPFFRKRRIQQKVSTRIEMADNIENKLVMIECGEDGCKFPQFFIHPRRIGGN